MGFLDAKERVLDVALTDLGRELLSQNLLNFTFFAFSDEGMDYGAALTASLLESGSVENYARRNLSVECGQRKDFKEQGDLSSFLYTVPSRRTTLPEFVTNFDDTPDLTAKRRFYWDLLVVVAQTTTQQPVAVVTNSTIEQDTAEQKLNEYVSSQYAQQAQSLASTGVNVAGLIAGQNQVYLNNETVLDTESGTTSPAATFQQETVQQTTVNVVSVQDTVEVVSGLDRLKINFTLKSSEGPVPVESGYLVEVFESGSDGKIIKVFEENVLDILEGQTLKKGFEDDLFFDGDAENADLISESEKLRRRELRKRELELERLQKELAQKLQQSSGNS